MCGRLNFNQHPNGSFHVHFVIPEQFYDSDCNLISWIVKWIPSVASTHWKHSIFGKQTLHSRRVRSPSVRLICCYRLGDFETKIQRNQKIDICLRILRKQPVQCRVARLPILSQSWDLMFWNQWSSLILFRLTGCCLRDNFETKIQRNRKINICLRILRKNPFQCRVARLLILSQLWDLMFWKLSGGVGGSSRQSPARANSPLTGCTHNLLPKVR